MLKENTMFETLRARIASRQLYNRTFSELNALTNRDLADMGIHRSDIDRIARTAAREKSLSLPI
jgi:uncharacterized protein YjiS (DUF1127 family)